ncbi:hypothetical protein CesoFtcFv8_026613 [Champsocephalus esox]|uniref:Uncharacterized protein n=1 Tax=Champsocephalus esox TaxID=159716 RepID=A0AAN8G8S8_9TELE|nr:hypothetical protein CesoFtcFv8_026613 [Champsocephalus esox]
MTRRVPINSQFQLELTGVNWINNNNGILSWKAVTGVELRNRSDIGQANTSPHTTILPALSSTTKYQSELRCVIVTVGNEPTTTTTTTPVTGVSKQGVIAMRIKMSSASPLSEDFIRSTIIQQVSLSEISSVKASI